VFQLLSGGRREKKGGKGCGGSKAPWGIEGERGSTGNFSAGGGVTRSEKRGDEREEEKGKKKKKKKKNPDKGDSDWRVFD